jgi:CMP-N-acetylneuraminic acid synthetase
MYTALLPMKLHSDRVPNKNFKMIAGQPLYQWILGTLLKSTSIDRIVINTDAPFDKFENYANNPRILLRKRSNDLCGDEVSMNLIIKDDLNFVETENVIMTHTTNPLITNETLELALKTFESNLAKNHDSLFSVTKIQGRFYDADAKAVNHDPENLIRTQDLDPYYLENSCLYVFSKKSFQRSDARIGVSPCLFTTPTLESVDIDTLDEWKIAAALLSEKVKNA